MPRQIDADLRRQEISLLAARLIGEQGVERLSLRSLAKAAGASTTVITHYFADKSAVLESAYHSAVDQARTRVRDLAARGVSDPEYLRLACETVLPLDEERTGNWRTWLAFFGIAISSPRLAQIQRRRVASHRDLLRDALEAGRQDGQVHPDRDPVVEARALLALLHGIASEAVFDEPDWPPDRQRAVLDRHLTGLRARPTG
jgi:AcrR family transcriptional regulator